MPLLRDDFLFAPLQIVVWSQSQQTAWEKAHQRPAPPIDPRAVPFVKRDPTTFTRSPAYGRQAQAIRQALEGQGVMSAREITARTGLHCRQMHNTLKFLRRHGEVIQVGPHCYRGTG